MMKLLLVIGVPWKLKQNKAGDLLTRWINTSEEKSFFEQKGFNKLSKAEEVCKMVASMNMFPKNMFDMVCCLMIF